MVCLRRTGFSSARETGKRARQGRSPAPPVPRALKRRGQWRGGEEAGDIRAPAPLTILLAMLVCFSGWLSVDRQYFPSLLPRFPNRSLCFGLERRNDRTLASDRNPYANRIPCTSNRSGCFNLKRRSIRFSGSSDKRRGTGVLNEITGPGDICGGIQWGAFGPPWPGGGAPGNHSEGSPGVFSFPYFFLCDKKKYGRRRQCNESDWI